VTLGCRLTRPRTDLAPYVIEAGQLAAYRRISGGVGLPEGVASLPPVRPPQGRRSPPKPLLLRLTHLVDFGAAGDILTLRVSALCLVGHASTATSAGGVDEGVRPSCCARRRSVDAAGRPVAWVTGLSVGPAAWGVEGSMAHNSGALSAPNMNVPTLGTSGAHSTPGVLGQDATASSLSSVAQASERICGSSRIAPGFGGRSDCGQAKVFLKTLPSFMISAKFLSASTTSSRSSSGLPSTTMRSA
jgi:hypothetical protein